MSDCSEPDQDPDIDEDIDVEHVAPTEEDTACSKGDSNDESDCGGGRGEGGGGDEQKKANKCKDFEERPLLDDDNDLSPEEMEMVKRALLR